MVRKPLPQPVSTTDRYLHDIATSLRQLCGDTVTELPTDGTVRLQEPAHDPLVCPCGKQAKSAAGLAAHRRACEAA